MHRYWSGEATYLYRRSNLKLSRRGAVRIVCRAHALRDRRHPGAPPAQGSRIRPFFSFGGGLKVAVEPGTRGSLSRSAVRVLRGSDVFCALTATREVQIVGELARV